MSDRAFNKAELLEREQLTRRVTSLYEFTRAMVIKVEKQQIVTRADMAMLATWDKVWDECFMADIETVTLLPL